MNNKHLHLILQITFGILLILGALLFTLNIPYTQYVFAVGAALAIVQSLMYAIQHKTNDVRMARLHRLHFIATLFLGIAAWLMFVQNNAWVVMLLIYVVLILFLSFRGDRNER